MKRVPAKTKTTSTLPATSNYPWAELYNLESQMSAPSARIADRRVGRPSRPIPRKNTLLQLTDGERRTLRQLTTRLEDLFDSEHVTRSQVTGFALQFLSLTLEQAILPEQISGWDALIAALSEIHK